MHAYMDWITVFWRKVFFQNAKKSNEVADFEGGAVPSLGYVPGMCLILSLKILIKLFKTV